MKRPMRILLAFFGAAVVLLALYFEPSHCVRGWLGSEAFFDGRPTSYWRTHVVHDLQTDPMVFIAGPIPTLSWLDRCKSSLGIKTKIDSSFRLVQRNEADAVLKQLADDGDAQVAGFARDVLQGVRAKQPFVDETNDEYREWVRLICTHNRAPQDFPKLMKAIEGE